MCDLQKANRSTICYNGFLITLFVWRPEQVGPTPSHPEQDRETI